MPLEIHVAHACNLACDNCSHFTNYGIPGMLSQAEAQSWLGAWGKRLRPRTLNLLGGEPTLNPELPSIMMIARECFPGTRLVMITNGYFLERHETLPDVARRTGTVITVTRHKGGKSYDNDFARVEALVAAWRAKGVDIKIPVPYSWRAWYRGRAERMLPFPGNSAVRSFDLCCASGYQCMQIHDGCLWKCPFLAYFPLAKRKFPGLCSNWDPILAYRPLRPEATEEELAVFLARKEEPGCALCPSEWIPCRRNENLP